MVDALNATNGKKRMKNNGISRRGFIQRIASASAAMAAPTIVPSTVFGRGRGPAPSDRVTLGHIGVGGQGTGLLRGFLQLDGTQSLAVCDPFRSRREAAASEADASTAQRLGRPSAHACTAYNDFRELLDRPDIDAVVVATPDHWHVPVALTAVRAGKDVYVEKPLGVSIFQNKALREAVHRHGRVFQYGTQQRSFNSHCAFACELVRNGYVGSLKTVHVVAPNGETGGSEVPEPVPADLDYDLWLGPAPWVPYTTDRVKGTGRWHIHDYALGFIAGWGAHPLDIAHWGYPHVPVEYVGTGIIPARGLFDTVVNWNVRGRYASGVDFTFTHGDDKTTFVGTEGWIAPSRGGIEAHPASLLKVLLKPGERRLLQANNHYRNFIDAVKSRRPPASDIDSAVQSDIMSHLSEMAIRLGRQIRWDPVAETVLDDPEAIRLMSRPMRAPWSL
jgi:predicted dehydrogenase